MNANQTVPHAQTWRLFRRGNRWELALIIAFAIGSAQSLLYSIVEPAILGSHAIVYTDAARTWLAGGNPWQVGPPAVVFAGPPPMLLLFLPFVALPDLALRVIWVAGGALVAAWSLHRLGLPGYWIGFPPLFGAIVLGHPEVLLLALLVVARAIGGLSVIVKPYAAIPLLAECRWRALALAAVVLVVSAPFLPWLAFFRELPQITATLSRQAVGDSTYGHPLLMVLGLASLLALGVRRGAWLAVPVLWPYAQPIYKVMTIPVLSPVLAVIWALPVPGATLAGVIVEAVLVQLRSRGQLPNVLGGLLAPAAASGPIVTAPVTA